MNRRGFGKLIFGSGLAAAIPTSMVSAATLAPARRSKYIFAVALAHNRVNLTADMIVDVFKVRPSTARRLMRQLVRNGVVDAPKANGVATLAKSLQRVVPEIVEYKPGGGYIVKGRLDELTTKAKKVTNEALDLIKDESSNEHESETEPVHSAQKMVTSSDDDLELQVASDEAHSVE